MVLGRAAALSRPPATHHCGSGPDQVKPTFAEKCPSLRLSPPPPAQCTMNASRMMARITTTTQKNKTMMLGMAYPATVLALAMAASYPPLPTLFTPVAVARSHGLQPERRVTAAEQ